MIGSGKFLKTKIGSFVFKPFPPLYIVGMVVMKVKIEAEWIASQIPLQLGGVILPHLRQERQIVKEERKRDRLQVITVHGDDHVKKGQSVLDPRTPELRKFDEVSIRISHLKAPFILLRFHMKTEQNLSILALR